MNPILIVGLVAVLAFIAPFFSRALKLPLVVGEILFGVLVGTVIHILGYFGVHADLTSSELEVLATLGFITLMFIIGMENDLEDLRTLTRREKWATLLIITSSFLISCLIIIILGLPIIIGIILGGVSVAVLLPILKDMSLHRSGFGFKMMLVAQIADLAAILLLSISAASVSGWITLLELIIIPVIFILIFWVMDLLIWHRPRIMSRILNPRDQSEHGTRAAFALMLIFYGLAVFIGMEAILGAFLCGMLFSVIFKDRGALMEKMMPLGFGFLIPIFFIYQGFEISIIELIDPYAILLLVILTGVAFLSKVIPLVLSKYFKHKESGIAGAVLLGTNLSVVVAGVRIGQEADLLDDKLSTILILYGVMSCVLFPMIFRWYTRKYMDQFIHRSDEKN